MTFGSFLSNSLLLSLLKSLRSPSGRELCNKSRGKTDIMEYFTHGRKHSLCYHSSSIPSFCSSFEEECRSEAHE